MNYHSVFNMRSGEFVYVKGVNYIIINQRKAILIEGSHEINFLRKGLKIKLNKGYSYIADHVLTQCDKVDNILLVPMNDGIDEITGDYIPNFIKAFKL